MQILTDNLEYLLSIGSKESCMFRISDSMLRIWVMRSSLSKRIRGWDWASAMVGDTDANDELVSGWEI